MQPGGGVMLLPFVRLVLCVLLMLTSGAFVAGVARIHMAVLTFLGVGLMVSLQFFESEYKKASKRVQAAESGGGSAPPSKASSSAGGGAKTAAKTD